jgi:hypothetical protein
MSDFLCESYNRQGWIWRTPLCGILCRIHAALCPDMKADLGE